MENGLPSAADRAARKRPIGAVEPSEASPTIKQEKAVVAEASRPAPPKQFARAPVPASVPSDGHRDSTLLRSEPNVGPGEEFSKDEELLNNFLKLHPMLSMEATNNRTLQLVDSLFKRATLQSADVPVVPKSHDDGMLRMPNEAIGERPCVNGDKCLARFVAQMRFGLKTPYAFTCTEFLLPADHQKFLAGKGLPPRRGKCLMCLRYFTNYVYVLARTDASFCVKTSPLGLQTFCNAVAPSAPEASASQHDPSAKKGKYEYAAADTASDMANEERLLREVASDMPSHCSIVSDVDGYRPSAMLFVDEDFANMRTARESKLGTLLWRPVVRFCSTHYKYVLEDGEPHIVQVNVGADDPVETLNFGQPPPTTPVGSAEAKRGTV